MIRLYCATGNAGKLREFQLASKGGLVEIEHVPDFAQIAQCDENGDSFGANAEIKARHYSPFAPGLVFADDSGLRVDALDGAPGIRSARFAGDHATDEENNRLLLEKLRGVKDRTARFVCLIALVEGRNLIGLYSGHVIGEILEEPRGSAGFGYDPLFYSPQLGQTFGEASDEEKFAISHRGSALRSMLADLERRFPPTESAKGYIPPRVR